MDHDEEETEEAEAPLWVVRMESDGLYHAAEDEGGPAHCACPATDRETSEDRATRLAREFNEEDDMAKAKKTKATTAKPKVSKIAKPKAEPKARKRDPRIPPAGTVIKKEYNGKEYEFRVNENDFTYKGDRYASMSAIAHEITEHKYAHGISGFIFFRRELEEKMEKAAGAA